MPQQQQDKHYLTPNEVASMLLVSPITVRQWAQKGLLESVTTAGGHRRFSRRSIEQFARERGIEVSGGRLTVLVAESDGQRRAAMVEQVAPGVEILEAESGFAAGLLAGLHQPELILLGDSLPGVDLPDVCRMVKERVGSSKTAIVLGQKRASEAERALLAAGADLVLSTRDVGSGAREALAGLHPQAARLS